jgi:hypothetical protein
MVAAFVCACLLGDGAARLGQKGWSKGAVAVAGLRLERYRCVHHRVISWKAPSDRHFTASGHRYDALSYLYDHVFHAHRRSRLESIVLLCFLRNGLFPSSVGALSQEDLRKGIICPRANSSARARRAGDQPESKINRKGIREIYEIGSLGMGIRIVWQFGGRAKYELQSAGLEGDCGRDVSANRDNVEVSWQGEQGQQNRARFALRDGQPVVAELAARKTRRRLDRAGQGSGAGFSGDHGPPPHLDHRTRHLKQLHKDTPEAEKSTSGMSSGMRRWRFPGTTRISWVPAAHRMK